MIFQRRYRIQSALNPTTLRDRLNLQTLKIHNLNFEITERDNVLKVIPQAQNVDGVKTLPITHIKMKSNGSNGTKVLLTSKPRRIDIGGPYLIIIFCVFLIVGAGIFYLLNPQESLMASWVMGGVGLLIFIFFWIKMEMGYFDYTRKIRNGVQNLIK